MTDYDSAKGKPAAATAAKPEARDLDGLRDLGPPRVSLSLSLSDVAPGDAPSVRPQRNHLPVDLLAGERRDAFRE